jgi:hypothetical protein
MADSVLATAMDERRHCRRPSLSSPSSGVLPLLANALPQLGGSAPVEAI